MAVNKNFLLGNGEQLVSPIPQPKLGFGPKKNPYTFEEAKQRLLPQLIAVNHEIDSLPEFACPNDNVVASFTLHPAFIAKSYFPAKLIDSSHFYLVGSRPQIITRDKSVKKPGEHIEVEDIATVQLFIAGGRENFRKFQSLIDSPSSENNVNVSELVRFETISYPKGADKLKTGLLKNDSLYYEAVLHRLNADKQKYNLSVFSDWVAKFHGEVNQTRVLELGSNIFVPFHCSANVLSDISQYSFLRAIRPMPKLRISKPNRVMNVQKSPKLPESVASENSVCAVFDGGLTNNHDFAPFVNYIEPDGLSNPSEEYSRHGTAVTSAALFGPIDPTKPIKTPYGRIDHYRVLDDCSSGFELYDVLMRIKRILMEKRYKFLNLSLGPALPIEDDEITAWTSFFDSYLSDGKTLAFFAVGNTGEASHEFGFNRIQVPSDSINGLAIGACDSTNKNWKRANYSSIGPGRSPGLVKPDLVAFGGSTIENFHTISLGTPLGFLNDCGTSFSAPTVMRMAHGLSSCYPELSPLVIKALLINSAHMNGDSKPEVGWGRAPQELDEILLCADNSVKIVYQGELSPKKWVRAIIPFVTHSSSGMVDIRATVCISTPVDPHHPSNYSQAGVEVRFFPNETVQTKARAVATAAFFNQSKLDYQTEDVLRRDAHKWETTLHQTVTKRLSSLNNPVFELKYIAREEGMDTTDAMKIPYSLVVTITCKNNQNFYNQIRQKYRMLLPMVPQIELPLKL